VGDTGYIENQTETPITVSVKVTGSKTSGSGVVFKTASTSGSSSTAKDVFAYFQMQAVSDPDSMSWDSSDANNSVVVSTTAKSVTDMVTLAKYDEDNVDTSANRYAAFKVDGDCVMFPDSDWTSKDGFTVQVVFTFKALPYDYEVD
jgi:copper(I)-binding protein